MSLSKFLCYSSTFIKNLCLICLEITSFFDATTIGAATDVIQVDDTFANALMNFALYRAYLKDGENAGNQQRAVNHYQLFAQSLAIGQESTIVNAPASEANVG